MREEERGALSEEREEKIVERRAFLTDGRNTDKEKVDRGAMYQLYDNQTGKMLGEVGDEQMRVMMGLLEEESLDDRDYYVNQDTVDMLVDAGAGAELVALLQQAMGEKGEAEVRWQRT